MRLLIVEDEKELCDTVAKSLYSAGYEVDTCYDGEEALDYVLTEEYDLIVLDLNLPGMDGMDILRELRMKNEETSRGAGCRCKRLYGEAFSSPGAGSQDSKPDETKVYTKGCMS